MDNELTLEERKERFKQLENEIAEAEARLMILKSELRSLDLSRVPVLTGSEEKWHLIYRAEFLGVSHVPQHNGDYYLVEGNEYKCKINGSDKIVTAKYICTIDDKLYGKYYDFDVPNVIYALVSKNIVENRVMPNDIFSMTN